MGGNVLNSKNIDVHKTGVHTYIYKHAWPKKVWTNHTVVRCVDMHHCQGHEFAFDAVWGGLAFTNEFLAIRLDERISYLATLWYSYVHVSNAAWLGLAILATCTTPPDMGKSTVWTRIPPRGHVSPYTASSPCNRNWNICKGTSPSAQLSPWLSCVCSLKEYKKSMEWP